MIEYIAAIINCVLAALIFNAACLLIIGG